MSLNPASVSIKETHPFGVLVGGQTIFGVVRDVMAVGPHSLGLLVRWFYKAIHYNKFQTRDTSLAFAKGEESNHIESTAQTRDRLQKHLAKVLVPKLVKNLDLYPTQKKNGDQTYFFISNTNFDDILHWLSQAQTHHRIKQSALAACIVKVPQKTKDSRWRGVWSIYFPETVLE